MDIKTELAIESLSLQCETIAAGMLTLAAQIEHIANEAGIVVDNVKLKPEDEENRKRLFQSIAKRIMKIAILSAKSEGIEVDQKTIAKNTVEMLQEAISSRGESLRDGEGAAAAIFKGTEIADAAIADAKVAEENADYAIDEEPKSVMDPFKVTDEAVEQIEDGGWEEDEDNLEDPSDEDLLAVFRSTRKKKTEDPYVEFENGVIRANFYMPETLPEDPEEFMDYERQAVAYFKSITEKAHKAKLIDKRTTSQVIVVLHGGVNFQEDQVMTDDRKLMKLITEQGHSQPYFEAKVENSIEAAEALITAYSVSIARLRGAYMQAKLQELQEYVEQNG